MFGVLLLYHAIKQHWRYIAGNRLLFVFQIFYINQKYSSLGPIKIERLKVVTWQIIEN